MTRRSFAVVVVAMIVVLLVGIVGDTAVDQWVARNRGAGWERAAKLISRYFAWHWLMLACAVALGIAWLRGSRRWQRLVWVMMVAASLAGLSADFLRGATGRTRPYYAAVPQGFYGVHDGTQWLVTKHAYNSFPSGHTAAITGLLASLVAWRRRLAAIAVPVICLVAASRVYLGAHHLSDVLAGALLGTIVALAVFRYARTRGWILNEPRPERG
jgi:undecaprenyl-diphosphatase